MDGKANVVGWSEGRNSSTTTLDTDSTLRQGSDPGRCLSAAAGTAGRDLYGRRDARNRQLMNRGRRQVTLTRESRGETACSLGAAMAIYTTALTALSLSKSNHNHHLSNPLIRLFSLLPTAAIDQGLSLILLCPCWSRHLHCVSTACFRPATARKLDISNRLGDPPSSLQPMPAVSQLSELLISRSSPSF
jgi:hypothetical protein